MRLPMLDIMDEVAAERGRQDLKWGEQNHGPADWLSILSEEVGESAKHYNERQYVAYRDELIQVAAVAIAAVESFDRQSHGDRPEGTGPNSPKQPAGPPKV